MHYEATGCLSLGRRGLDRQSSVITLNVGYKSFFEADRDPPLDIFVVFLGARFNLLGLTAEERVTE
jgi:hypothetical protein